MYSLEAIHWPRDTLIFIDEVGFDRNQKRRRGRSRRGRPATVTVHNNAGPRINVCAAVSPQFGMVQYEAIIGTWDSYNFRDFMSRLTRQNAFTQYHSFRIILDGVKWHYADRVKEVLTALRIRHELIVLPPYSPHLNVIEYCFHVWKSEVKSIDQLTATTTLQQQIDTAARLITPELVNRCMDHVFQYYTHCIEAKPLGKFIPLDKYGKPKAVLDRVQPQQRGEEMEEESE